MSSPERIGIIGAGLAGLSAACTLAARGYDVTVFERNHWLGGKNVPLEQNGFRFDMGPTILIMPSVLRRIFREAGESLERWLPMVHLDPQWRSFFNDGTVLDLAQDTADMTSNLDAFSPGSGEQYAKFLSESEKLRSISDRWFFWKSLDSIWDTFDPKSALKLSLLQDVRQMRLGQTVTGTIKSFVKDKRVVQMLEHFVQYVGSAPDNTPAILCAIANMQTSEGVWYPLGGTAAIPKALVRLAERLGVQFRTGVEITRILHDGASVTGIELAGGEYIPLAAVVSNSDAIRTYTELLGGDIARTFKRKNAEPACSGVVLYLGLDRRYEHLAHHDFVFSRDPQEEFDFIYRKGEPAPDPTCYLCAPSSTDPTVAPEGGEALYVLVHTPYLRPHHDWKQMFPKYRNVILDKLRRTAGLKDIDSRIRFEACLTPEDIHNRYRVLNGAIYGIASHGRLNGGFKPGNESKLLNNLYLCGGAAHPGPGMPMVLMSGWIAADALDQRQIVPKRQESWVAAD
jgi:diapolycopene oxygenase